MPRRITAVADVPLKCLHFRWQPIEREYCAMQIQWSTIFGHKISSIAWLAKVMAAAKKLIEKST